MKSSFDNVHRVCEAAGDDTGEKASPPGRQMMFLTPGVGRLENGEVDAVEWPAAESASACPCGARVVCCGKEYSHPRKLMYPVCRIEPAQSLSLHDDPKGSGGASERFLDVAKLAFNLQSFLNGIHRHPHLTLRESKQRK